MKRILLTFSLFLVWSCSNDLPRATSDELPCDVSKFDQVFYDVWGMATNTLDGLMVVQDGKVIYEKYESGHGSDNLHALWSVSKTFTATAVGFAQQDGLLSVDDKVLDFFEDEKPAELSEWLKQMTIKDLLIMSSGFKDNFSSRTRSGVKFDWVRETLAMPIVFEPGTMFHYNSMDSHLLSAIVSKVTRMKMEDYLDAKLFKPLGIRNWEWKESPQGHSAGGYGLYLTLESMAKMGQFFLNRGTWNGKRLLNEAWFEEAMKPHILQYQGRMSMEEAAERYKNDEWHQGYGYQMWISTHGAVRLDGAWGQYVIIVPEKKLVVACQSHNPNGKRYIQSVWDNIYDLL